MLPQTLFLAGRRQGAEEVAQVPTPVSLETGQGGCLLTAAVDTKERWRPKREIEMVLTGLKHLVGQEGFCPEGQTQTPFALGWDTRPQSVASRGEAAGTVFKHVRDGCTEEGHSLFSKSLGDRTNS